MSLVINFEIKSLMLLLVHSLSGSVVEDVSSQFSTPATMPAVCFYAFCLDGLLPLWNHSCLGLLSIAVIKHYGQKPIGKKGFISAYSCSPL